MVNIAIDAVRTLILPILSDKTPRNIPVRAIANAGRVIIREMRDSDASGNASLINGRAGATAAPPMRIIMADNRRNTSVHLVGLNNGEIMPYLVTCITV